MKVRHPHQAGLFYAGTSEALKTQIERCFTHKFGPGRIPKVLGKGSRNIVGLVCPHAGYIYSGPVAAHAYYKLAEDGCPKTVVFFGPNHTGLGSALTIMNEGFWRTPLGNVEVDTEIANQILLETSIIDVNDSAHAFEHSIEVQLPFLQYLYGQSFKFVPICFLMQDLKTSREVGEAVATVLSEKDVLIIASTDLTHYESQANAEKKDNMAIKAILNLDEEELYSNVESYSISMCGYGPTVALITAAKTLGAKKAELLCYKTSGNMMGDFSAVVGYASLALTK